MSLALPGPSRLRSAVERVVKEFPVSEAGELMDSVALVAAEPIWRRLLGLSTATERTRAAGKLSLVERRVLAMSGAERLQRPECVAILPAIMSGLPGREAGRYAWTFFLESGGDPEFKPFVVDHLGPADPPLWRALVRGTRASKVAASAYLEDDGSFIEWLERDAVKLDKYPHFQRSVARVLLSDHIAEVYEQESARSFQALVASYVPENQRDAWYRLFLLKTVDNGWPRGCSVMEGIVNRFESPDGNHPFWESVPPRIRRSVRGWLNYGKLVRYLGDNRRTKFWRGFLDHLADVKRNKDREAVILSFDSVVAVTFVEPGRATYLVRTIYAERHAFIMLDAQSLYQRILALHHKGHTVARYEQRGENWEREAREEVQAVLQRYH